jgi:hypothetical protein
MATKKRKFNNYLIKLLKFAYKNYFLTVFVLIVIVFGLIFALKFFSKPTYAYVRIQINWPASYYSKPYLWLVDSIKKDVVQENIFGQSSIKVLGIKYYPQNDGSESIYVDMKLLVGYDKKTGVYTYQRLPMGVGSPIDISLPVSQFSGTVININNQPLQNNYIQKNVLLVYKQGYNKDSPYLYNNIQVGDKYFDGQRNVFEILDKNIDKNIINVFNNFDNQVYTKEIDSTQNIVIKAKISVVKKDNQYIYGENQIVKMGDSLQISTDNLDLGNFIIAGIE